MDASPPPRPPISSLGLGAVVAFGLVIVLTSCAPTAEVTSSITPARHSFIPDSASPGFVACGLSARRLDWSDFWAFRVPPCTLDAGLGRPRANGTPVHDQLARLGVLLPDDQWSTLSIRLRSRAGPASGGSQHVETTVNGELLGRAAVEPRWHTIDFQIPARTLRTGENTVTLRFERLVRPTEGGRGDALRAEAAVIRELWFNRAEAKIRSWPQIRNQVENQAAPSDSTRISTAAGTAVEVTAPGQLVLPLDVPDAAVRLGFTVRPSSDLDPGASTLSIRVQDVDGDDAIVRSIAVEPATGTMPPDPVEVEIPIPSLAGRIAIAAIDLDPQPTGATIGLADFRFTSRPRSGRSVPNPGQRDADPTRPDIVLITLDAARPDHFSGNGYHRTTTPRIDGFADQALVFRNAFALAPYTLCSVPTMITGLSFLDHGVVGHEDVLSPAATTLAESLRQAGYRTACFTATPNNSAAKGFDQGYDEFHELWTEAPGDLFQDPHYVTSRAVEWLESAGDDRPLHLQVHYIPPHAPYAPAKPFDLFSDPSYDGPCTGDVHSFDAIEHGLIENREDCVAHLIDLYDGNLRAADDAAGELLDTLRRRSRWTDTVVLITSDHGEAFLEHGRMTHNTTVYDEMLRVPFILRIPDAVDREAIDTARLVTLADIVPTLLATASLPAPGALEGLDLLAAPRADTHPARFFVARNSASDPLLALRTLRFKVLLTSVGFGALFDLEADPGELENLQLRDISRFTGLGLLLTDRAARPPRLEASADRADITAAEREQLEALGYVR